jgi:oligoribonuclease NrnB/cAMP/cGMP phosphodiesterase (DHH superfamily)
MKHVIYHNNCYDGFTSAFVFDLLGKDYPEEEIKFYPTNHGDPFPIKEYNSHDECYILDFSFKRDIILKYKDTFEKFLILDHHATAQEDLKGLDCAIFDMTRSGAKITFDYLWEKNTKQWDLHFILMLKTFVERVSDRDLFQFKYPLTSETYFVQSAYPMTFENWHRIVLMSEDELEHKGKLIQQYERVFIEKRLQNIYFVELTDGEFIYNIPCVNLPPEFGTNACKAILNLEAGYSFACYHWYGDGKKVWGIRSKEGYDCSKIASYYGGGGHKEASGWLEKI